MPHLGGRDYNSFILEKGIVWESPSENFSWWKMKRLVKLLFTQELRKRGDSVRVLDAGCGIGTDVFMLNLEVGNRREVVFHGVDASGTAIRHAEHVAKLRGDTNCSFFQSDVRDLSVTGPYDIVICSEVIEHLQEPLKALQEFARVLRKGGTLILTTPNKENLARKLVPSFLKAEKHYECLIKRHGYLDVEHLEHADLPELSPHISEMTLKELRAALRGSRFEIEKVFRGTLFYVNRWLDDHPLAFAFFLALDRIADIFRLLTFSWGFVIKARRG